MRKKKIQITWFGRCCFLVETDSKKVLFDPYDTYCNVDIGIIEADVLLSSSSWHDHGHIGASPKAHIYTYPGSYKNSGFQITGIEAQENRGTPTVIFNLRYKSFSITNFADFGPDQDESFYKSLNQSDRKMLSETNVAFIRPDILGDEIKAHGKNIHIENALKYCNPSIIFPEHYFPESFIQEQVEEDQKEYFLKPNILVNEMIDIFKYPVKEVEGCSISIQESDLSKGKLLYKFFNLHPQVKYHQ